MSQPPIQGHSAVLVTGGARRLGAAICRALSAAGRPVVIHHNVSDDAAARLREDIVQSRGQAWTLGADLAEPGAAADLLDRAWDVSGGLGAVVNNAASFPRSTLRDLDWADLQSAAALNAWAPLELTRAFAGRAETGCVINLLDARLGDPDPERFGYHLSKVLLAEITRACARTYAPGIRVNAVAPGASLPPADASPEHVRALADAVPLRHTGTPEQVGAAVAHLLEADFTTGQVLYVDGGRHLMGGSP